MQEVDSAVISISNNPDDFQQAPVFPLTGVVHQTSLLAWNS